MRNKAVRWLRLNKREVERTLTAPTLDLKEIIVLDSIDPVEAPAALQVRSHDLYGPLPEIQVAIGVNDRLSTLDRLQNEAVKLCAVGRIRRELAELFP